MIPIFEKASRALIMIPLCDKFSFFPFSQMLAFFSLSLSYGESCNGINRFLYGFFFAQAINMKINRREEEEERGKKSCGMLTGTSRASAMANISKGKFVRFDCLRTKEHDPDSRVPHWHLFCSWFKCNSQLYCRWRSLTTQLKQRLMMTQGLLSIDSLTTPFTAPN